MDMAAVNCTSRAYPHDNAILQDPYCNSWDKTRPMHSPRPSWHACFSVGARWYNHLPCRLHTQLHGQASHQHLALRIRQGLEHFELYGQAVSVPARHKLGTSPTQKLISAHHRCVYSGNFSCIACASTSPASKAGSNACPGCIWCTHMHMPQALYMENPLAALSVFSSVQDMNAFAPCAFSAVATSASTTSAR